MKSLFLTALTFVTTLAHADPKASDARPTLAIGDEAFATAKLPLTIQIPKTMGELALTAGAKKIPISVVGKMFYLNDKTQKACPALVANTVINQVSSATPEGTCYRQFLKDAREVLKDSSIREGLKLFPLSQITLVFQTHYFSDPLHTGVEKPNRDLLASCFPDQKLPEFMIDASGSVLTLSAMVTPNGECRSPDRGSIKIDFEKKIAAAKEAARTAKLAEVAQRLLETEVSQDVPAAPSAPAAK